MKYKITILQKLMFAIKGIKVVNIKSPKIDPSSIRGMPSVERHIDKSKNYMRLLSIASVSYGCGVVARGILNTIF